MQLPVIADPYELRVKLLRSKTVLLELERFRLRSRVQSAKKNASPRAGAQYDYVIVIKLHARGAPPSKRTLSSTICIVGRSGLGNLELKMVAISYEMSLCFGSTQPEPATYGGQTARGNMRSHSTGSGAAFFYHVPPWIPFSLSPPSRSSHHHQHHGPCLF